MDDEPHPDWVIPPYEGFVAEDLDRLTALPRHTELIDGSLVIPGPKDLFHQKTLSLLELSLHATAPDELEVIGQMTVTLSARQRPEPDIMIVGASAMTGLDQTTFQAGDAILVAEVITPESRERDEKRKPSLYAEAGIPNFWLVENIESRAVVRVYELVPDTSTYKLTGIYHDRLELSVPFSIDIDLTKINKSRRDNA